ncbi:MAG: mechanosensitive ion channel family protein [Candidatus Palauibacterales bacterium]|nr:mechanosensitive ion channel family protein [Candidatus Palauibacterales bacterium]MDP2528791.1 mechanosensitive ion channel family protein [Candidatus Palauibacterales bacterium]
MNEFLRGILARLGENFAPGVLGEQLARLVSGAVAAGLTFLAYYVAWRLLDALLRPGLRRTRLDKTSREFAHTVVRFLVLTVGAVAALSELGIGTTSLLASLGVAGITLGLAARETLSNLISGFFIYWDRPFVIGDLVEVKGFYGTVDRITMRSTRIVTPDGKLLAIPNSDVVNTTVASYTNFPHLRLDVDVSVGTGEDFSRVRSILLEIVKDDPDFLTEPAPRVVVTTLGDFNVGIQLQAWLDDERGHVPRRFDLRERVFEALRDAGVDMPTETIRVTGGRAPSGSLEPA